MRLPGWRLVLVAVALVVLVLLGGRQRSATEADQAVALPVADGAGVLTSSWFCPSAQGVATSDLATTIDVANPSTSARSGTVTWYAAADGTRASQPFTVEAGSIRRLRAMEAGPTPVASALVETTGGGIVVEQSVSGARGSAVSPCASDASGEWLFANGTTLVDATEVLSLFNPFPADAVVDVEFATAAGRVAPGKAQGFVVPSGSTRFLDVTTTVLREPVVAAAVRARTGRVVAARLQTFDGTQARTGVSLVVGARAPAEEWLFAEGQTASGWTSQWQVFNPGGVEARVVVDVSPMSGEPPEPVEVTVPPKSQVTVPVTREGGVPADVVFSSAVRSINGVPVVAELVQDARAPYPRRGWSSRFGAVAPARRAAFAFAEAGASPSGEGWLSVFNPGVEPAALSVEVLGPAGRTTVAALSGVAVPANGWYRVRLADLVPAARFGLEVRADGPVLAERMMYGTTRAGIDIVGAVPVPEEP